MKELSIEQKAEAYDKALERMKSWVRGEHPECFTEAQKAAEFIFPELKESEDEKIRKKLISFVKNWDKGGIVSKYTSNANDIKRILAWLEKQGEKPQGKSALEAIKEEKVDNANKVEPKDYSSIDPHFFKTTDKVEPKFKVGDWITDGYLHCKITEVLDDRYILDTKFGKRSAITFKRESDYHLWTIADAKDGDVLFHSDSASNGIFIFKEIIDKGFAKEVICYCDYDSEDHFCLGEHHTCCWADAKILHPATKEQRELLFQKMQEAGYEWDTEKKELEKIKMKPEDEAEHLIPQKGVYYTCIKDYYSSNNTHLYVKGNIYKSSFNGYIDDESHFGLSWTNSCAEKYFEPTKDEDWIVCEHDNVIGKPMQYKEFKKKVNQKFIENLKAQGLTPKLRLWNLQDAKAGER